MVFELWPVSAEAAQRLAALQFYAIAVVQHAAEYNSIMPEDVVNYHFNLSLLYHALASFFLAPS